MTSTGPLCKWAPASSHFRAATLGPSVSPVCSIRDGCSRKACTLAVWICPHVFLKCRMTLYLSLPFPKVMHSVELQWWVSSMTSLQQSKAEARVSCFCMMWQSGYEILAWLQTGTHSEEASRCRLPCKPSTGNYNTLVCGGKMPRTIFVRRPWLCWVKGESHPGPPQHEARVEGEEWKCEAGARFFITVGRSLTRGRPRSTLWWAFISPLVGK